MADTVALRPAQAKRRAGWLRALWHEPRRTKVRQWLFQIHLWSGLILGLVIGVVSLTGAIVVFRLEMNRLLIPGTAYVAPAEKRLPLDELVARIQENRPHDRVRNVAFDQGPDVAWMIRTETPEGHRLHTSIDQYRGVITGQDDYNTQWMQWIFELHAYLLGGERGLFINGFVGLATLLMAASGIVVWWPGRGNWRFGFKYLWGGRWQRQNYDLHKVVGVYGSALLALVSFTGAYFSFPNLYRKAASVLTFGSNVKAPDPCAETGGPKAKTLLSERQVPMEDYIGNAERALPGLRAVFISLPMEPGKPVGVKLKGRNDWHRVGLSEAYLEPATGEVIASARFSDLSLGSRLTRLMLPLHFGRFGGRLGLGKFGEYVVMVTYVAIGLAVAVLMVTGYLMYWNRVLSKKVKRGRVGSALRPAESSRLLTH
jgi:uncharacterized iron-regulated membrane protein